MLEFYQSTIYPPTEITGMCVGEKSDESTFQSIIVFHNSVQEQKIYLGPDSIIAMEAKRYYTGTPIILCKYNEGQLYLLNENNIFTITELGENMIEKYKCSFPKNSVHYDLFAISRNKKYAILTAKNLNYLFILHFLQNGDVDIHQKYLERGTVLAVSQAGSHIEHPEISFLILIQLEDSKEIKSINASSLEITSTKSVNNDALTIVSWTDGKKPCASIICKNKIYVNETGKKIFSLKDQIIEFVSDPYKSKIILFTDKRSIMIFNLKSCQLIIEVEECPLIKNLVLTPHQGALAVMADMDNAILSFPKDEKKISYENVVVLDLESPLSVTSATIMNGKLVLGDTRGIFPFIVKEFPTDPDGSINMEGPLRIFTPDMDTTIIANETKTKFIKGKNPKIKEGALLGVYSYEDLAYCVFTNGIYKIGDKRLNHIEKLDLFSSYQDKMVIIKNHNEVEIITLDKIKHKPIIKLEIPDEAAATAVSLFEQHIAVCIYNSSQKTSKIMMLSITDLSITEFNLPSKATDTAFTEGGKKIYIGLQNGSVMILGVDPEIGFTRRVSYVYIGNPGTEIHFVRHPTDPNALFFYDRHIFYLKNGVVQETAFGDIDCFDFFADAMGYLYMVTVRDGKIIQHEFETELASTKSFYPISEPVPGPIEHMAAAESFFFALRGGPPFELYALDLEYQIVCSFEAGAPALGMTVVENDGRIDLIMAQQGSITGVRFTNDNDGGLTHSILFREEIEETPYSIATFGKKIVIGFKDHIGIAEYGPDLFFLKSAIRRNMTKVTKLAVSGGLIWAAAESSEVFCVTYNDRDDVFEELGKIPFKETASVVCPIDEASVVIATTKSRLAFLRVSNRVSLGLVQSQERVPNLEKIGSLQVAGDIAAVFEKDGGIVFVLREGTVCGLTTAVIGNEFRRAARFQRAAREQYQKAVPFFDAGRSLAAQRGVVDVDFLEGVIEQGIDPDPDFSVEVMSIAARVRHQIIV